MVIQVAYRVAIIDEDLEIAHEDLVPNIVPNQSYNVLNFSTDPTFQLQTLQMDTALLLLVLLWQEDGIILVLGGLHHAELRGCNILLSLVLMSSFA